MNEKLYKIFEAIIDGVELTTKNLKDLGYSSNDLNALIKDGSLIRVRRGLYSLSNVDGLLYYGKGLLVKKQYDRAYKTFNKCYEIDPNNSSVCFQMFLRAIKTRDYEGAIKLYEKISDTGNEGYDKDAKIYLYLLSKITKLPVEYVKIAKNLGFPDVEIKCTDKRFDDILAYNNIRKAILDGRTTHAIKLLNNQLSNKPSIKTHDLALRILMYAAADHENSFKQTILSLINDGKYETAIKCLSKESHYHRLSFVEQYTFILLEDLIRIMNSGKIPEYKEYDGSSVFRAIREGAYKDALKLGIEYDKKMGIANMNSPITILLTEICELIKSLSDKKVEEVKPEEVKTIIPEPTVIDNVMAKPVKLNKVTKSLEVKEKDKTDETYVSKKHDELVSKDGVLLLNQMDEARASRILDIVSTYPDMRGFTIGTGNKTQVVLVHKPKVNKFYDIPGLLKEADIAYDNGDYQKCIDIHLLLLKLSNFPLSKSYIKLGLSYRKLYDKESAIKYLTIADDLAHKEEGNTNDFSNLIFALKGGFNRKEAKLISEIRINEEEFDPNNMNDYFGFDNFREINDYITESGLDIESACEKLEMTPEEINILRLVYAREYYIFSNFTTGDLFLSTVEKSKDKTPEIKRLIKEIRESRKFYQTRTLTAPRPTVLVLKPKKSSGSQNNL